MPLSGYMKTLDPGRISSVSITGFKERRKKLLPTKYDSDQGRTTMYVRDCVTHDAEGARGGLVPVELFTNSGGAWVSQGIAKCCVLCWLIVIPPSDDFPSPQPLPVGDAAVRERGKGRGSDKKPRTRSASKESQVAAAKIVEHLKLESDEPATTASLMGMTGLPRATLNRILAGLITDGKVWKDFEMVDGQSKATYWGYPPEK